MNWILKLSEEELNSMLKFSEFFSKDEIRFAAKLKVQIDKRRVSDLYWQLCRHDQIHTGIITRLWLE